MMQRRSLLFSGAAAALGAAFVKADVPRWARLVRYSGAATD